MLVDLEKGNCEIMEKSERMFKILETSTSWVCWFGAKTLFSCLSHKLIQLCWGSGWKIFSFSRRKREILRNVFPFLEVSGFNDIFSSKSEWARPSIFEAAWSQLYFSMNFLFKREKRIFSIFFWKKIGKIWI